MQTLTLPSIKSASGFFFLCTFVATALFSRVGARGRASGGRLGISPHSSFFISEDDSPLSLSKDALLFSLLRDRINCWDEPLEPLRAPLLMRGVDLHELSPGLGLLRPAASISRLEGRLALPKLPFFLKLARSCPDAERSGVVRQWDSLPLPVVSESLPEEPKDDLSLSLPPPPPLVPEARLRPEPWLEREEHEQCE